MEDPRFNSFRYGLASFSCAIHISDPMPAAHWWMEDIENYGDAVRFRDKLRAEGGNKMLLEEYERRCLELEIEVQSHFLPATIGRNCLFGLWSDW
ncbi:hypothetical protein SAMN05216228_102738 [Rhizobium tibeticum]|uniref:Uncharacterized protein n=1 Tax=Rhizobium tibeticum TaxID=501024 RepID=A0A1H8T4F2_9HYPH|nr:hypothetical protein [Rhizobium tibeticum]SEI14312.1 hypothetical protein RTCCBAU85039_5069 [Rhizobium tibeticum]SEO85586.1 hypothetical protein SAMN05216228_102738 [Rhizobium tibeticum]